MNHLRILLTFLCFNVVVAVSAQDTLSFTGPGSDSIGAPVVLQHDTLFNLYGSIGPFTSGERAEAAEERIRAIARMLTFDSGRLEIVQNGLNFDIHYGLDTTILTVTPNDALQRNLSVEQTASDFVQILQVRMTEYRSSQGIIFYLKIAGSIVLVVLVLWVLIWLVNRAFRRITSRVLKNDAFYKDKLNLHKYKLITVQRQKAIVAGVIKGLKWLVVLFLVYLALPVVFSIAPLAEGVATRLIGYVTYPLRTGFFAIIAYIPKAIIIVVIVFVVRAGVRVLRSLSKEVAAGKVELKGFYADWAMPTFNLLKFIVYIFTFVLIFPLLPGSGSAVFQGVSVFLGLLISLGSQSAISNIISGLVITYMRAFNIGDRVRIGETTGDVLERSLLVTKVRTIKNEDVTIPNSNILTSHTVNYTSAQNEEGLVLHTTVTIGYDVPWRKVKALLVESALKTQRIESDPEPFVLQTSLDDFYVSYQLNAYTKTPAKAAVTYSELHSNIQDVFAKADVEIMSPHYRVNRQMLDTTIPTEWGEGDGNREV